VVVFPVPGEADDEHPLLARGVGITLQPGVQSQPAPLEDQGVHIRSPPFLDLSEVVGVEHPGDPGVEVDGDDASSGYPGAARLGV